MLQQRQQPLPGRRARLRPELQLARPEPPDRPRGDGRLPGGPHPRPAGRHLPAHRGQPLHRAVRRPCWPSLAPCGNPSSGFFDPLIDEIPTILNTLTGQGGATTEQSLLQQGLHQIAGARAGAPAPAPRRRPRLTVEQEHHRPSTRPRPRRRHRRPRRPPPTAVRSPQRRSSAAPDSVGPPELQPVVGWACSPTRSIRPPPGAAHRHLGHRQAHRRRHVNVETDPSLTAPSASLLGPLPAGPDAPRRRATAAWSTGGGTTSRAGSDAPTPDAALRLLAVPAAALVGALGLAGCSSGPSQRTATAVFSDVGDLANGAQVQLADVPVGSVTSIALSGNKAKVTLAFDNGVRIPADVSAAIDRTTILGDQFVAAQRAQDRDGTGRRDRPAAGRRRRHPPHLDRARRRAVRRRRLVGLRRHLDHRARADHRGRAARASPVRRPRSRRS